MTICKRDKATIAIAKDNRLFALRSISNSFGHAIRNGRQIAARGKRAAKPRQFRNDDAKALRKLALDAVEAPPVSQERMKQNDGTPFAE